MRTSIPTISRRPDVRRVTRHELQQLFPTSRSNRVSSLRSTPIRVSTGNEYRVNFSLSYSTDLVIGSSP